MDGKSKQCSVASLQPRIVEQWTQKLLRKGFCLNVRTMMSAEEKNTVSDNRTEKPNDKSHHRDNLNSDRAVTSDEVHAAEKINPNRPSGSASEKPRHDDASLQIVDAISGTIIAERPKYTSTDGNVCDRNIQTRDRSQNASLEVLEHSKRMRETVEGREDTSSLGSHSEIRESFAAGSHLALSLSDSRSHDNDPALLFRSYVDGNLDQKTIDGLTDTKLTSEQIRQVRNEVNKQGMDPSKAIVNAMKHNRVLILGETHTTTPDHNSMRLLGPDLIPALVHHGATHLALEIDIRFQPYLEQFQKTGIVSDQFKEELTKKAPLLASDDYYDVLRAANKAGLKLIAVDKPRPDLPPRPPLEPGQPPQPLPVEYLLASKGRDEHMAKQIEELLKDPEAKVVFWVGKKHGEDPSGNYNFAAEVLRNNGHDVATVRPEEDRYPQDNLSRLLPDLKKSVAIPTAKTPVLGSIPTGNLPPYFEHYKDWDIVIAFPDPNKN